jgi:hypothetical protein
MLWGSISNRQNPLFNLKISLWVWRFASEGFPKQHAGVPNWSFTQALFPFLDPSKRSAEALSEFLPAPFRMFL